MEQDIFVYADWVSLDGPTFMGTLHVQTTRGRENYSFSYDEKWLELKSGRYLDPDLNLYEGRQASKDNLPFGIFLDSMPDRWGKQLMRRFEAYIAQDEDREPKRLREIDYLLKIDDTSRMGALRFALEKDGDFQSVEKTNSVPPLKKLREIEAIIRKYETDDDKDLQGMYVEAIIGPGSSLGGARPKISVIMDDDSLWLAKFPSHKDEHNVGLWEYLIYQIALEIGIDMSESAHRKLANEHDTFLTKRFDRNNDGRIHFCSAMTALGIRDGSSEESSYIEIAQFISDYGSNSKENKHELFTRLIFNIAVSNTDDHLRNHGFLLDSDGWRLSPAYDINPSLDKSHLSLLIDEKSSELSFSLAIETRDYYGLNLSEAKAIVEKVVSAVSTWEEKATALSIPRAEIEEYRTAFLPKY